MTITFTTYQAKASRRAAGRVKVVSTQSAQVDARPTDDVLAGHLGQMTVGWDTFGERQVAQFCRREGTYDYITEVEVK